MIPDQRAKTLKEDLSAYEVLNEFAPNARTGLEEPVLAACRRTP
jgi:hypothetical protein